MKKEVVFDRIFNETKDQVYGLLRQYTHDHHLIEDVMQMCYIRVWERMDRWEDRDKLGALIKVIAKNLLLNEIRQKARLPVEWLQDEALFPGEAVGEGAAETAKMLTSLDQAIDALPEQCRKVFLLHREERLSYREIAARLSISTFTVKNHMSKAISLLSNSLRGDLVILVAILLERNA